MSTGLSSRFIPARPGGDGVVNARYALLWMGGAGTVLVVHVLQLLEDVASLVAAPDPRVRFRQFRITFLVMNLR